MRKLHCSYCGAEMEKEKIDHYDYTNGEPIWMMKCPNYRHRTFWEKFFSGVYEDPHYRCLENACFSSFDRK